SVRILEAGEIASRFVEEQMRRGGARADGLPIEGDGIDGGIGLGPRLATHHPIHGHATGGEEGLSPAARAQARLRQDLADADRWQECSPWCRRGRRPRHRWALRESPDRLPPWGGR